MIHAVIYIFFFEACEQRLSEASSHLRYGVSMTKTDDSNKCCGLSMDMISNNPNAWL